MEFGMNNSKRISFVWQKKQNFEILNYFLHAALQNAV
jgi:hypothetical protein